jgi:hypothetical protein
MTQHSLPTIEDVYTSLHERVMLVTFKKVDGSLRDLKCSLRADLLPPTVKETVTTERSGDAIRVYDLENSGWRSFKYSNLISIHETNE